MKISSRRCIAVLACLALPMIPACSQKKTGGPAQWTAGSLEFFRAIPEDADHKYVHMMHLDGFRPDLFKALLDANKLPHFQFMAQRGKYTTNVGISSEGGGRAEPRTDLPLHWSSNSTRQWQDWRGCQAERMLKIS